MDYRTLFDKTVADLRKIARDTGVRIPAGMNKAFIVEAILEGEKRRREAEAAGVTPVVDPPRKRGRPRKNPLPEASAPVPAAGESAEIAVEPAVKTDEREPQGEAAAPDVEAIPAQTADVSAAEAMPAQIDDMPEAEAMPSQSSDVPDAEATPAQPVEVSAPEATAEAVEAPNAGEGASSVPGEAADAGDAGSPENAGDAAAPNRGVERVRRDLSTQERMGARTMPGMAGRGAGDRPSRFNTETKYMRTTAEIRRDSMNAEDASRPGAQDTDRRPRRAPRYDDVPRRAYAPRDGQNDDTPRRAYTPRDGQGDDVPRRAYAPRDGQNDDVPRRAYAPREAQTDDVRNGGAPGDAALRGDDLPEETGVPRTDALPDGDAASREDGPVFPEAFGDCEGILEIHPDGYGFLRAENYLPGNRDAYVSATQIRRFNLRTGDLVTGKTRPQQSTDRSVGLVYVSTVNGDTPDKARFRRPFDTLVPVFPNERLRMEDAQEDLCLRMIDMIAPIGKGQRGMIVSPPKAGKTTILKKIANAITAHNPEVHLITLLIDERPEEVTDMQRSISGEVVYSTFDEAPENHTRVSEMVLERAQRLVELGRDVVILLDSITRLARAYNLVIPPTGRSLSGGLDPGALFRPKRFFGAARNIENGGSLTIIATALVDTGSRMDDIIFEEFKGTGNMELRLDRSLSDRRIFPAIDLIRSGTRREDLLMTNEELEGAYRMRRMLMMGSPQEATEQLYNLVRRTRDNSDFFGRLESWLAALEKGDFSKK